jgi:recombinational DNA repair ATPase RecF
MRKISNINLTWFRGAAESAVLQTNDKNVVVYGLNGSGKSSFCDALEYIVNGRIEHLRHEYSGSKQEKGVCNTHAPDDTNSNIAISFSNGEEIGV